MSASPATVTVLGAEWREGGRSYRERAEEAGITMREVARYDMSGGFHGRHVTLYAYRSEARAADVYVVEVDGYDPPDSHWVASTVLDGCPSLDAVMRIGGGRDLSAGDQVEAG